MEVLPISQAKADLDKLVEQTADSHKPIMITGKSYNAVLISEQDWNSIQETLYLLSISGMRESIIEGLKTPLADCDSELDW